MNPVPPNPETIPGKCLDDDMLWSYLHGDLDPAEALLVATHYQMSVHARQRLELLNRCAATILDEVSPVAMSCCPIEFLANKCKGQQVKKEVPVVQCMSSEIPKSLQPYVDKSFASLAWEPFMPGIDSYPLKVEGAKVDIRLMRVKDKTQIFEHGHTDDETVLILKGSVIDGEMHYMAGDVMLYREKHHKGRTHAPFVVEECICLVTSRGDIVVV
jgi:predicted ChrR family anti-sigma factor